MLLLTEKKIRSNVAGNVLRLRGERSQPEIARLCSCDEWKPNATTIDRIEKGMHSLKIFTVYRLAVALEVSLQDLISRVIQEPKEPKKPAKKRNSGRGKKPNKTSVDSLIKSDKVSRSADFDDL